LQRIQNYEAADAVQSTLKALAAAILNQFWIGRTRIDWQFAVFPKLDEKVRNAKMALVFEENDVK
jgi:hypothetical protein